MQKYELVKDSQSELSTRLDRKIAELQFQRPTLSDAEIKLKEELMVEMENISEYRQKYEQIKRKHRYQDAQLRKAMINDESGDAGLLSARQDSGSVLSQLNSIKEQLTCQ